MRKERIRALEKNWGRRTLDEMKTNFGAVDNESTGLFAVDQDVSLPDSVGAWSVSMGEYIYTVE